MHLLKIVKIYIFLLFFISPQFIFATDTYTKYSNNPIINLGPAAWDNSYAWQPSVISDGINYKMYYSGFNGSRFQIGLAQSNDGLSWTKVGSNPIISRLSLDNKDAHDPTVLFDGTNYQMWYVSSDNAASINFRIQRATSVDGLSWQNNPISPVLSPSQSWDANGMSSPYVLKNGSNYQMWYSSDSNGAWKIGYATSPDGINWTPYIGNPIFSISNNQADGPSILYDGVTYEMFFHGMNDGSISYTTSSDGIIWTNPISTALIPSEVYDSVRLTAANVISLNNGTRYLYYGGRDASGNFRISMALNNPINLSPTPTSTLTPTPSPSPNPTPTPTPTPIASKKVIVIPGVGGSWNFDALFNCKANGYSGSWTSWEKSDETYQPLLHKLEANGYAPMPFYYDWRKQVTTTVPLLSTFIQNRVPSGQTADLVGHSLGGLVGRAYLQNTQTNSRLGKLLTVGSAHQGTVVSYPAWSGGQILGNIEWRLAAVLIQARCFQKHAWLPRQTIQNILPSVQNLLPTFDYLKDKKTGNLKQVSTMKAKNNWLPNTFTTPFFDVTVGAIAGTGQNTLRILEVEPPSKGDQLFGNWLDGKPTQKQTVADGDGMVLAQSAQLPGAQNFSLPLNHGALVYAPSGIGAILNFLSDQQAVEPFSAGNLRSSEKTIIPKKDASALMVIVDGLSATLTNKNGQKFNDSDGQITILNPRDEAYTLTVLPRRSPLWWKSKYTVLVVQLFEDGTSTWKEYSMFNLFSKRWKLHFDRKSHHADILRDN